LITRQKSFSLIRFKSSQSGNNLISPTYSAVPHRRNNEIFRSFAELTMGNRPSPAAAFRASGLRRSLRRRAPPCHPCSTRSLSPGPRTPTDQIESSIQIVAIVQSSSWIKHKHGWCNDQSNRNME
jgi:hypothetical protein